MTMPLGTGFVPHCWKGISSLRRHFKSKQTSLVPRLVGCMTMPSGTGFGDGAALEEKGPALDDPCA
jgi:hypothetical protein